MEIESKHQNEKRSIISILKDKTLSLPLFLTCALQGGSQLSGITAVYLLNLYGKISNFILNFISGVFLLCIDISVSWINFK